MMKNLIRGGARCAARVAWPPRRAPAPSPSAAAERAARRRLRLRHAGRRGRLDLPARARPARDGACARRARRTIAVESVAEGPDAERVMRDLVAQQGATLVFATSFGYLEPALRVAAEFPQARFEHAGGYKSAPNLATYDARYYEARWLAGWLAGRDQQERRRRLRRRLSGARGRAGHQRVRARHARRQPEGDGARRLAEHLVRSGAGSATRRRR